MKTLRTVLIVITMLLRISQPVWGAAGEFKSLLGFGGYTVPGRWTPLRVLVKNANPTWRLEIRRRELGSRLVLVESFPYRNDTGIECPIFVGDNNNLLVLRLVGEGQVLAEEQLDLYEKTFPGHLVLTVKIPATTQREIETALSPEEPVLAEAVALADLPARELSYDGVSGLVMADPGPILSPAQAIALRNWLAGGGRLIVLEAQYKEESIITQIIGDSQTISPGAPVAIKVGIGSIIPITPQQFNSVAHHQPEKWRRLLNLKPYLQTARVTASFIWESPEPFQDENSNSSHGQEPVEPFYGVALALLVWSGALVLISFFTTRRRWLYCCCCTVFCAGLAFPVAEHWSSVWGRGADVHYKMVLIPGSDRALADLRLRMNRTQIWEVNRQPTSPWGVVLSNGLKERGAFGMPEYRAGWDHQNILPELTIRTAHTGFFELTGAIPFPIEYSEVTSPRNRTEAIPFPKARWLTAGEWVWWNGRQFWNYDGMDWLEVAQPAWLKNEQIWLNNLQLRFPDRAWLIGYSVQPDLQLKVQNLPPHEMIWLMPLFREL